MLSIRTAEEMARVLATPIAPPIADALSKHLERLSAYTNYELGDLAVFAIVQAGEPLSTIEEALGLALIGADTDFLRPAELIREFGGWYEVTFILSDDGYGLVLFVPIDEATEPRLLHACKSAQAEAVRGGKT